MLALDDLADLQADTCPVPQVEAQPGEHLTVLLTHPAERGLVLGHLALPDVYTLKLQGKGFLGKLLSPSSETP